MRLTSGPVAAFAGVANVLAHSYVRQIDIDLKAYTGFDPITGSQNAAVIVGWSTTASDQGWVGQDSYRSPDIICHRNGSNAQGHAPIAAGDKVHIQWNGWPQGHKGPVMDYLAACDPEGCQSVDKSELQFFKINQRGLVNSSADQPYGQWATDQLIANNNSWLVEIPASLKSGFYVLRTEIIALHNLTTGPQHYPQCLNFEVTGPGTSLPSGTFGEALYSTTQPGLRQGLNITTGVNSYLVPGPTLVPDAISVSLSHPIPTGTGTVIRGFASALTGPSATSGRGPPFSRVTEGPSVNQRR